MLTRKLPMRLLRELLRLRHAGGLPQQQIARSLSIGLATVCECLGRTEKSVVGRFLLSALHEAVTSQ